MQKHSEHPLLITMLNLSICDEKTGLSVVEHNNILSTAFVVPALAPATINRCISTQETVESMENTDYFIPMTP